MNWVSDEHLFCFKCCLLRFGDKNAIPVQNTASKAIGKVISRVSYKAIIIFYCLGRRCHGLHIIRFILSVSCLPSALAHRRHSKTERNNPFASIDKV